MFSDLSRVLPSSAPRAAIPHRRPSVPFTAVLALIIAFGLAPRLASFQFGLPYVEWHDEAHLYWYGQCARGLYDPAYCRGYPPGYVALSAAAQHLNEWAGRPNIAPSVETLRLLGVLLSALGIAAVGSSARLIAGNAAGWIAAGMWALSPLAIEYSLYAIPESITIPLSSVAVLFALRAWRGSPGWALVSLLIGAFAALFDYRIGVFILPGLGVLSYRLLRGVVKGGRGLLLIGGLLLLALAAFVGAVLIFVPAARPLLLNALETRIWDIGGLARALAQAHDVTVLPIALIVYVAGIAALVSQRRRLPAHRLVLLAICAGLALVVCVVGFAVDWDVSQPRARVQNLLPAAALFCVLIGCCAAFALNAVRALRPPALSALPPLSTLTGVAIAAALLLPQIAPTLALVEDRRRESVHVLLRHWVDDTLEPGTILVADAHHKTFNPFWGGIPHRQWFDWWLTDDFTEFTAEGWRERGMSYAALPLPMRDQLARTPAGAAFLDSLLPLLELSELSGYRGSSAALYRLWRMEHETDARFGASLALIGYDGAASDAAALRPGAVITLRPYWRVIEAPTVEYSMFVHVTRQDDAQPVAQWDGAPARLPTYAWTFPDATIIGTPLELAIPADLPPGAYQVRLGLYDFQTGVRLPVSGEGAADDAYVLASFTVTG